MMSTADDSNNNEQCGGSEEIKSSKKECTSCEQNNIDTITEGIDSIAILDDKSICAACGKEGNSNNMNTCNKCKSVKYCNAACKKKHRSKHKKACERRVAELYDEQLFKDVEPDECPICLIPMPLDVDQISVESCCGKRICIGCMYAMKLSEGKDLCAFCRTPNAATDEEEIKRVKNLMDKGVSGAFFLLAGYYALGDLGLTQDRTKCNELLLRGGQLGYSEAYYNLGNSYEVGRGVVVDKKKSQHYFELAAMGGNVSARYNLGLLEYRAGNQHRAFKHFTMAARAGHETSLEVVKAGFRNGLVTKDEYANTLRAHHESQKEMKSDERDKASKIKEEMRRSGFRA